MTKKKEEQLPGQIDIFGNVHEEVKKIRKTRKTKGTLEQQLMDFNMMVDHEPLKDWIKVNKNFENAKYIPIRIIEALLKSIFGAYQVKQSDSIKIISDNILYSVDLVVYHPVIKEWITFSGVGAAPLRTEKTGVSIALHGNAPMARAYAITNAAKSIGKLFGSSLNNLEDEMIDVYDPEFKKIKKSKGSISSLVAN
jgi:hypothetical protein